MTEKRFTKYVPDSYNYTSIITIVDHETNKRSGSIDDFVDMMNALHEENEQLKKQIEYQEEGILDAIDSLIELPSATIYLLKQWLDAFEEYDSIEDMKNTFSEKIKELEE